MISDRNKNLLTHAKLYFVYQLNNIYCHDETVGGAYESDKAFRGLCITLFENNNKFYDPKLQIFNLVKIYIKLFIKNVLVYSIQFVRLLV